MDDFTSSLEMRELESSFVNGDNAKALLSSVNLAQKGFGSN